jgi:hypothetical protein
VTNNRPVGARAGRAIRGGCACQNFHRLGRQCEMIPLAAFRWMGSDIHTCAGIAAGTSQRCAFYGFEERGQLPCPLRHRTMKFAQVLMDVSTNSMAVFFDNSTDDS